ncbi:uroporphyrinogen decarboxylase family protein [Marispirochaeta sp.]|jgi:uroporphyrinogen-III decarboxylase|uniref:uroporphyrinogen decarboxylase family protein n=1 Tax=Marispirochaeta sp. TaxID=2038653 RepID=UPI0029C61341|nr:uroporphyrinogen decarboxylase family protein [Marispirochaeta sp.]
MNYSDIILAAIKGEPTPELPCAPRMDLWYLSNYYRGTLPKEYHNATLLDIMEDLDVGFNTTNPNFLERDSIDDEAHRALGRYQSSDIPYRVIVECDQKCRQEGDLYISEYFTPHGTIRTQTLYTEEMRKAGITNTHIQEKAFKSENDYAALGYVYEHMKVEPRPEAHEILRKRAGDRGPFIFWVTSEGSPYHLLSKYLMPFEIFCYEMFDHPEKMQELADRIRSSFYAALELGLNSEAEILRVGSNYDSTIENPPFFREHILPTLKDCADKAHEKGKFLLSHTDGENSGLLDLYMECGFDIADSVCPAPMTSVSFKEHRKVFTDKVSIYGGVPSIIFLPNSVSEYEFEKFLDDFLVDAGDGKKLIVSIADTAPPDANFNRIRKFIKKIKEFGPVG